MSHSRNDASLDLATRRGNDGPIDPVHVNCRVRLRSNRFEVDLLVRVTHRDGDQLGGVLIEQPHPLLGKGDHLHFNRRNVLSVEAKLQ